jgi:hypothetical protein
MRFAPLLAVLLVGCVSTNAMVLNPSLKLAPVCPDGVLVYTDSSKVGQPYTEVALLNSKGDYSTTDESGMMKSQRKKAGELGANGIILGSITDPTTGAKVWNALLGTAANRKGKAIAIFVRADSTRVAAACAAAQAAQKP